MVNLSPSDICVLIIFDVAVLTDFASNGKVST